jgi:putative ATP-dependent endonuclease of OLD family
MFLSTLKISGYRVFNSTFDVNLRPGLNILVGENGSGKSTVIDAIRLLLLEDEYGRTGVDASDFHRPIDKPAKYRGAGKIAITAQFSGLSEDEQVAYIPWLSMDSPPKAYLNLAIENKVDGKGHYKRKLWANESHSGIFEWELLNRITCIYLPPLRNASDKLRAFRGSRLARLLINLNSLPQDGSPHPLESKFAAFNRNLLRDSSIQAANKAIKDNLLKAVGATFGQDSSIQFSEISFDRIVERLNLLFYPLLAADNKQNTPNMFRSLDENSLGYNNMLYLATILAELEGLDKREVSHKVLLIEEPEAHLHPQLQIRLLQFLEQKAREQKIQIIVTTHSPTLSASVSLDSVRVLSILKPGAPPMFTALSNCGFEGTEKKFIERWLDITKSTLLFAKGVLLVEGISEALIIRELSRQILVSLAEKNFPKKYLRDLDDYGISMINLNGIYFRHFMCLFKGYTLSKDGKVTKTEFIPVKCAGLTDNDPESDSLPTPLVTTPGKNNQLYLVEELKTHSSHCRLFSNLKTFEYDLAMEGDNIKHMAEVQLELTDTNGSIRKTLLSYQSKDWKSASPDEKAAASQYILDHIDKGEFAQLLSEKMANGVVLTAPAYITDALKWLVD